MKVLLAGLNVDYDLIKELKSKASHQSDITPETISAAYARISRSPKPVDELRRDALKEVEKARRSNRNIVFEMGHSSIAEHAVFNIDVLGVSRLLVEEIEKFRLCSYTEKSQRYVLFDKDYVVPEEIREAGLADVYIDTLEMQNDFYHSLYKCCGHTSLPAILNWQRRPPTNRCLKGGPRRMLAMPFHWQPRLNLA